MPVADVLFYALAVAALGGAALAALRSSLGGASRAALWSSSALALLWALAGVPGLAALQLALAATVGGVLLLAPRVMAGNDGDRAALLRRAAAPLLAWLVLLLRVLLMTRWSVDGAAVTRGPASLAVPGLLHHVVLALALLALALLAAASRRTVPGAAIAAASAGSAAATMLVAYSRFTGAGPAAAELAFAVLASSWILSGVAVAMAAEGEGPAPLAPMFAAGVSTAAAGVALALLAGTW